MMSWHLKKSIFWFFNDLLIDSVPLLFLCKYIGILYGMFPVIVTIWVRSQSQCDASCEPELLRSVWALKVKQVL